MRETQIDAVIGSKLETIEKISLVKKPSWIVEESREIYKMYKNLREHILVNRSTWNYFEYCHRFSLHYYNIALLYYTYFKVHNLNINIIRMSLDKCLSKLNAIRSTERQINKTQDLFTRTTNFKNEIDKVYIQLESKFNNTDNWLEKAKFLLNLGHVDYENFNFLSINLQVFHSHVLGIYLMNFISDVEEMLTLHLDKDHYTKSNMCRNIARTYEICGQKILHDEYMKRASKQIILAFEELGFEDQSSKHRKHIRMIVKKNVEEYENNLTDIYKVIKTEYKQELSNLDCIYVEQKFIKYCTAQLCENIRNTLYKIAKSNNKNVFIILLTNMEKVKKLTDLQDYFIKNGYYKLILHHQNILTSDQHKQIIKQYKKDVWDIISPKISEAQIELDVLKQIVVFLRTVTDCRLVICELELSQFCSRTISVQAFLKNIINLHFENNDQLTYLKSLIEEIKEKNDLFFMDKFIEILQNYAFPPEPKIEGDVMKLEGKVIILSEIMRNILEKKTEDIKELRFVGADIFIINKNLSNEEWSGVNVLVISKTINVQEKSIWDVSGTYILAIFICIRKCCVLLGHNGEHYPSKAADGMKIGEDGTNGKNGRSGCSGGNVYICCANIINSENLTIISNGGNGGNGQSGGNGERGEDGVGISASEFENFLNPPVPKYRFILDLLLDSWRTMLNPLIIFKADKLNLNEMLQTLERERNLPNIPIPKIAKKVKLFDITWTQSLFRINFWNKGSSYFTGNTEDDCYLTYSYYSSRIPSKHEVLVLYKGTNATLGGNGGKGGSSGPGGFAGDITVKCLHPIEINLERNSGKPGQAGTNGNNGPPGINGWDMGYTFVNGWFKSNMKFIGKNQNSKIEMKYYNNRRDEDCVYCPYRHNQQHCSDYYIGLKTFQKNTQVNDRYLNRQKNQEKEDTYNSARNKSISSNVISQYEENINNDIVDELVELTLQIEYLKDQVLEEIVEKDEEKEIEMTNFQIQRQVAFDDTALQKECKMLRKRQKVNKYDKGNTKVDQILSTPNNTELWLSLKHTIVSYFDLQKLFHSLFENKSFINHFSKIYGILLNKYKIAMCQEIENNYNLPQIEVFFKPNPIEKYLVVDSTIKEVFHEKLGILHDYFQPNVDHLLKKLQIFVEEIDIGFILYPLKFFIMEKSYNDAQFKENSKKVEEELNNLEIKLERLIKCYMVAYEKNETSSMLCEIEKCKNQLIMKFKIDNDYNFILEEFKRYIGNIGMSSTAVRELLAVGFRINIQIYLINQNNDFILYHNHNPLSKQVVYLFLINGQYVQFRLDDDYVNLITERNKLSKNYSDLLGFINDFVCKKDFDEFYKSFSMYNGSELKSNTYYLLYKNLSEDTIITQICKYFPANEFSELFSILSKLKYGYICNENVLKSLLHRFDSEGNHISISEIIYLVDNILKSFLNKSANLEIFEWIMSCKPQFTWVNEVFYMELENYFKKSLSSTNIHKYIKKVKQKDILYLMNTKLNEATDTVSLKCINTCLEILGDIEIDEETIRTLPLSKWQYTLREQLLEYRLLCITKWNTVNELQRALYYLNCIENNVGFNLINLLLGALDTRKTEISSEFILDIFYLLHIQELSLNESVLNKISKLEVNVIKEEIENDQKIIHEDRSLQTLLKLIEDNSNTSSKIKQTLSNFECNRFLLLTLDAPYSESKIEEWTKDFKESIRDLKKDEKKKIINEKVDDILIMILHAIKLKKGFVLRTTQRLAILLILRHNYNILSQISTGEGKSLIVVAVSIFKALCGEKVDIITSSSVLAIRDATIHEDIYSLFNISVNHNCSEKLDERRDAYSACPVIFGDLSNFQRDYLLDRFYEKNILGDRNFDTLIVDEVDSMLLDKGNNTLYLSHEIAGLDKLDSIYQFLWRRICMNVGQKIENFEDQLKKDVMFDLYGTLHIEDLVSYLNISSSTATDIYNYFKKIKIVNNKNIVLKFLSAKDISEFPENMKHYMEKLIYIINQIINRKSEIKVPKFLYNFIENHVDIWIKNGLLAIVMEESIDYVLDVDRTQTKADLNPNITIIDKGTGTDQSNSQWEEALHQFLQLKHGCKVSPQSLKAVFISNVSYFKKYNKLFGLTGTLGSKVERDLLKELYDVQFVNIPTAKPKRFIEQEPLLCCTETDWQFTIVNRTKELTNSNRSVLIICETIKEVNILQKVFLQSGIPDKKIYKREYEEYSFAQGKESLNGGSIIIATNLAGRGTDIKITDDLNRNGGLHVLLTYFPTNARIEQQAFGRAARSGCNGSGQLVIIGYGNFLDKHEQREIQERQRIADIKIYFDTRINVEETYFEKFAEVYKKCNSSFLQKFTNKKLKEIASQRLLDRWAFWIDEYESKPLDKSCEMNNIFNKFQGELSSNFTKWENWIHDPIQLVKVGLNYIEQEKYEQSIKVFNTVINQEPEFCEAAHYYKALALARLLNFENRPFKNESLKRFNEFVFELRKAEKLFEIHKNISMASTAFIQNLKQNMKNSFMTIDAYKSQQETIIKLYDCYILSIHDILGHTVIKSSFMSQEINQNDSEKIYESFLKDSILKSSKVVKSSTKDIKELSTEYGIPYNVLSSFISSYEGKNIKEQYFLKDLKQKIKIPNLEDCWDMFVKQNILINEKRIVIIPKTKLTTNQESSLNKLTQFNVNLKHCNGKYVFMKQYLQSEDEDIFIFDEKVLKNNKDIFDNLKNEKITIFNRLAELSTNIPSSIGEYDYVTIDSLMSANIIQPEAQEILNILCKKSFLKTNNISHILCGEYDESKIPKIPVYEQCLSQILRINFAYRIVLQNIQNDLKNTGEQVYMKIISEPHTNLMWDLSDRKIIEPVYVNDYTNSNIERVLSNCSTKSQEKCIQNYVKDVLKYLVGTLKSLDTPTFKLISITECIEDIQVSPLQELNTFITNSLEFIIKSEEEKYTWGMIRNTLFVTVLGLLEVAVGLLLQLFFAGILSHLGNVLLSEGLNDLQYAMGCSWSGYFDWSDYGQYKLQSIIQSLNFAAVSRGAIYSKFGEKLAMSGLKGEASREVSKMTGKLLIEEVGGKAVIKEFSKQFIYKVGEGISHGAVNQSINHVIDSYLQNLCNKLSYTLMQDIEKTVNSHSIRGTLIEYYKYYGHKGAKENIVSYTNKSLSQSTITNIVLAKANEVVSQISSICAAASQRGKSMSYMEYVNHLSRVLQYSQYIGHIHDIVTSVRRILDKVNQEIQKDLHERKKNNTKEKKCNEKEINEFKNEVIVLWRNLIQEKSSTVFAEKIAKPILRNCSFVLLRKTKEGIKKIYNFSRNTYHRHVFEKEKQNNEMKLSDRNLSEDIKQQIIKSYNETLQELQKNVRDPSLYADIVMEKGYMDAICIKAGFCVLNRFRGDCRPVNLKIDTNIGNIIEYCTSGEGESRNIKIKLQGDHYVNANNTNEVNEPSNDYNCLYKAIVQDFTELNKITADEFRAMIYHEIKTNVEIKNDIREGKHAFTIRKRIYGGYEDKSIATNELRDSLMTGKYCMSQSSISEKTASRDKKGVHLFELAQSISENFDETKRVNVVKLPCGKYIFLDNRRVIAAATINNPDVKILVRNFQYDEILPLQLQTQYGYTTQDGHRINVDTAGSAAEVRIQRSASFRRSRPRNRLYNPHETSESFLRSKPYNPTEIRIRRNDETGNVNNEQKQLFYRRLQDIGFIIHKRTESVGRIPRG